MTIDTPKWVKDSIFYQIFPDRFLRSGRVSITGVLEDWDATPTPHGFKGGDLWGVLRQLDYLQSLGITAIYFCPIFSSAANHRYHTYDYLNVDPLLGGNEALAALLKEAHSRDMKVVLDGVFNHASRGFWQFHHVLENGSDSPYADWFHFEPSRLNGDQPFQPYPAESAAKALADGTGSYEAIGYGAWWNLPALPKFNTDCLEVREFLLDVATHWIEFGIDGWRLDVPNEIDDDEFWREFRRRVRAINPDAYIVGEVWGEAKRWLQGDMWDAVMNYQITAACLGYFGGRHLDLEETRKPCSFSHVDRLDATEFISQIQNVTAMYAPEVCASQLNLLDSHDMPRFLTCCNGNIESLKMAWLFTCLIPGAPCVYYGDEIGLDGRQDPDCRKGFPWDEADWNHDLKSWYKDCIELRKQIPEARNSQPALSAVSEHILCVRHHGATEVIALFNTGHETERVELISLSEQKLSCWQSKDTIEHQVDVPANSCRVLLSMV